MLKSLSASCNDLCAYKTSKNTIELCNYYYRAFYRIFEKYLCLIGLDGYDKLYPIPNNMSRSIMF